MSKMKTANRLLVVLLLLIGLVACCLAIRVQGKKVDALSAQVVTLTQKLDVMSNTMKNLQTATTKSLDELSTTTQQHDSLITELERLLNAQQ